MHRSFEEVLEETNDVYYLSNKTSKALAREKRKVTMRNFKRQTPLSS